ncbi:MAG TPA: glycosyltransferase, partial [Chthoniobacteraceae bacterium]|nr:glycosyltransferase [Chthoniobacteraceae bacterium]
MLFFVAALLVAFGVALGIFAWSLFQVGNSPAAGGALAKPAAAAPSPSPTRTAALRAEGYEFVTVSQFGGKPRDEVMPLIAAADAPIVRIGTGVIGGCFSLLGVIRNLFFSAIVLGIARTMIVPVLALIAASRLRRASYPAGFRPTVSALIPAFNERAVIARTVRSLLRSDYELLELVVIDDGSNDDTAEVVAAEFADEPRVRVLRQANGGKSAALNLGVAEAAGEVLICCDADTHFAPEAVGRLVRHFADPRVGAVA